MAPHRVLVVDDEFLVRIGTAETLKSAGFDVAEASDVESALALLRQDAGINLVCTDVHMPGEQNGVDLALWVRAHRPDTKIIVMSGYSTRWDCQPDIPFLAKPYNADHLVELARELLDGVA